MPSVEEIAMESAARTETLRPELVTDHRATSQLPAALPVSVRFALSEAGRKLSVAALAFGSGVLTDNSC